MKTRSKNRVVSKLEGSLTRIKNLNRGGKRVKEKSRGSKKGQERFRNKKKHQWQEERSGE